ncbi:hypothetical protein KPY62_09280 [Psychrobacter sp. TAE2020]|nr:hypothetical protein [Psychrobacter sp. TAE2020]
MTQVGFTNLTTEWRHFDYGNRLWAYNDKQKNEFYGAAHWDIVFA